MTAARSVDPVRARWALLAGNFAVGCGVMVAPGALNNLSSSLQVSPAAAGQLVTAAAFAMGIGAPVLAALLAGWPRRRLLVLALVWLALGHALCVAMPNLAALLPVRALCMLGAAVFTPQAAAAIGALVPAAERGRAIAFVFLGWALASVIGMPVAGFVAETWGWRIAFLGVGALCALAAVGVWRALPAADAVQPMSLASWRAALTDPLLMGMVAITALSAAGQFTLFSYFAPYYRQVLQASPAQVSFLFLWFGVFGVLGNLLLTRWVDRIGAGRAATLALAAMALSLAIWPLGLSVPLMAVVLLPWGLGCFAANSAQQARLAAAAPAFAPALMALNTSAIYVGQGLGAGGGGALLASAGWSVLSWAGLSWLVVATLWSAWLARRIVRPGAPA